MTTENIMLSIELMAKNLDTDCYSIIVSLLESGIIGGDLANELTLEIFKESK